jgi:hypothetical protein
VKCGGKRYAEQFLRRLAGRGRLFVLHVVAARRLLNLELLGYGKEVEIVIAVVGGRSDKK